jgi:hypothetical protein
MNAAESTYVRQARPRPTLVPPPSGDGTGLAASVLALPLRLAATPLGRRVLAAATVAVLLVALVGALYDHTDRPGAAAAGALAGAQATASRQADPGAPRSAGAAPTAAKRTGNAAEAAAAWFAGKQQVAVDRVRALQQRRVSATERQVLVVAEAGAAKLPSAYVTVRKGPGGWAAVS